MSDKAYQRYLAACDEKLGPLEAGQYGVVEQTLVKKLDESEFEGKYSEFQELERIFKGLISSGATIDDALYQELKELATELLMTEKAGTFEW